MSLFKKKYRQVAKMWLADSAKFSCAAPSSLTRESRQHRHEVLENLSLGPCQTPVEQIPERAYSHMTFSLPFVQEKQGLGSLDRSTNQRYLIWWCAEISLNGYITDGYTGACWPNFQCLAAYLINFRSSTSQYQLCLGCCQWLERRAHRPKKLPQPPRFRHWTYLPTSEFRSWACCLIAKKTSYPHIQLTLCVVWHDVRIELVWRWLHAILFWAVYTTPSSGYTYLWLLMLIN